MFYAGCAALESASSARAAIAPLVGSDTPHECRTPRCIRPLMADRGGGRQSWRGARVARPRGARPARQSLGGGRGHQRPLGARVALRHARAFVWRTPDERIAASVESAPVRPAPPPPTEAIAAPAPAALVTPAPEAIGTEPPSEPAQGPTVFPAPRTDVIIDPASMAPDDPGPEEHAAKRRGWLYANE